VALEDGTMMGYRKYHPVKCDTCGADLKKARAVSLHVSVADLQLDLVSEIMPDGLLVDRDRLVHNGYHAGTFCRSCDRLLVELSEPS
jgi:ribosomal protein S26